MGRALFLKRLSRLLVTVFCAVSVGCIPEPTLFAHVALGLLGAVWGYTAWALYIKPEFWPENSKKDRL